MTFSQFIKLTLISTAFAWGMSLFLLWTVDPVFATWIEMTLFYLSNFVAVAGTLSAIMVAIRTKTHPETVLSQHVHLSFRQAVLFALLIEGTLLLLSKNLLTWWTILVFIAVLSLIELNFQTLAHKRRSN
ncbi:MAG: hypothetical protein O2877_01370 [bacterium]|nr:hypothetical protein [bacterium]